MTTPAQPHSRTTPDEIRRAIQRQPEGPIILWHFTSTREAAHLQNKNQLNETCTGPGNGVLEFAGGLWKVVTRCGQSGGGFVMLEKLTPQETQNQLVQRKSKTDIISWWQGKLVEKGLLSPEHAPRTPVHAPRPAPGYSFAHEEDCPDE